MSDQENYYGSSYFGQENRGEEDRTYYGSSTDPYDVRYADDPHLTYGKQYTNNDNERR